MLREYINRKIRENEDIVMDMENDIKKLRSRKKELEKLIEVLEDENNDGSEIFSPRNHREENINKLNHYREDVEKIEQETEEKLDRLSRAKKKQKEYKSMLEEAEKNHLEEAQKYADIDYRAENQTAESQQIIEKNEGKEQIEDTVKEQKEKESAAEIQSVRKKTEEKEQAAKKNATETQVVREKTEEKCSRNTDSRRKK